MSDDLFYLPIKIGDVELKNPFIVASGPTVKRIDQMELAEKCGWGAASIKQAFNPFPYINYQPRYRWLKKEKLHTFTAEYRLDYEAGLRLVEDAKKKIKDMVIFANYSYVEEGLEGWQKSAKGFEAAGADILELNFCCPNMSFNVDVHSQPSEGERPSSGASMGQDANAVRDVVKATREVTDLPIIAKITPEGGEIAQVAKAAYDAGANAVCDVANRLGIAPVDIWNYKKSIYPLQGENTMGCLSGPWILPLSLRDVYEIRNLNGPEPHVVGTGGIARWQDAVQMIMCGADTIGVCTKTMTSGYGFLEKWMKSIKDYMDKMGFKSARDMRDLLLKEIATAADLTVWAGYAQVDPEKCNACGLCVEVGQCNAIVLTDAAVEISAELCQGCHTCIDICPKKAIEMVGEEAAA